MPTGMLEECPHAISAHGRFLLMIRVIVAVFALATALRVSYRTGKVTEAVTTFGDRVVCARCASLLDRQRLTGELRKHLLTLILCLLVLAAISSGL